MKILVLFVALISFNIFAAENTKTICGVDDRIPSRNPKVARALASITQAGGCTLTMISDECAVSAGHCKRVLGIAEFNTPPSIDGRIQHPGPEDIYEIDKSTIAYSTGMGKDWAVMKLRANNITGLLPGDAQGYYNVSFLEPKIGQKVVITGFGLDTADPERNLAQQTHSGKIVRYGTGSRNSVMYHNADTMGGNSGSSIIEERSQQIVAIHTHGGCTRRGGTNASTLIYRSPKLVKAIKACLKSSK